MVPNCVKVDEAFEKMVKENTPSDREWGKSSTVQIYADATPGQSFPINPLFEKKKEKKKLAKEDNTIPRGGIGLDGIGPETTVYRPMVASGYGGAGTIPMYESITNWMNNPKTQQRFSAKYGDLAEQKLYEAAERLNELQSFDPGPKFFTKLRENWEAIGGRDMGTVAKQGSKEEIPEESTPAWQRKEGKNPEGGLNKKGIASYRRENPGSKLSLAVTTPPSKLKPGSKKAKRRLSFCRRMKGMKAKLTSAKTARDPDSRINKSLRKWNCEE